MSGFLLHQGARVVCAHGGAIQSTAANPRVLVSGQPTLFVSAPTTVAGCTLPTPPAANGPDITGQWILGTMRLFSVGQPLATSGGAALTAPGATPKTPVSFQVRVRGM